MEYVHINDLLQAIEFSDEKRVEKSKNMTVNSITKNGKISNADVCNNSKKKDVK